MGRLGLFESLQGFRCKNHLNIEFWSKASWYMNLAGGIIMYFALALVIFPVVLADGFERPHHFIAVDPADSKGVFESTIYHFSHDRDEFVSQGLGRLTSDGQSSRERLVFARSSQVAAIKANTVRLIRPDHLPPSNGTGRVEVFHNGQWGTVCDKDWDIEDAQVVCNELNMLKVIHETRKAKYGEGTGPIWLSGMQCKGKESSMYQCKHNGWGEKGDCTHKDDAGVKCLHTAVPAIVEIGCYKDKEEPNRALRHLIANLRNDIDWYNVRSMVTKCAELAHEKGFKYFGIQFYGECWADSEAETRFDMYGKADPTDKNQKCFEGAGMHYANFVYRFAPWRDLGCWRDVISERVMPKMLVNLRYNIDWFKIDQTVYQCYQAAKKAGYKFFALQFYGECWVSNEDSVFRVHGPSTNCWNGVGGHITNYVYQVAQ